MIRLQVVVEGATEERFVKGSLSEWLASREVYVTAMKVLRGSGARGGGSSWQPWQRHLSGLLRQDTSPNLRVTTLLDLYAIPDDTPGNDRAKHGAARADAILHGMQMQLNDPRLIPYIQVHEFESLLFADLATLNRTDPDIFEIEQIERLADFVKGIPPEGINEDYETCPSRRIKGVLAAFDKVEHGPRAAGAAGLTKLRGACPRFDAWITRLEGLRAFTPHG